MNIGISRRFLKPTNRLITAIHTTNFDGPNSNVGIQNIPGIPTVRGGLISFTSIIRSSSSHRRLLCLINIQRLFYSPCRDIYPPIERPIVMFPYLIHAPKLHVAWVKSRAVVQRPSTTKKKLWSLHTCRITYHSIRGISIVPLNTVHLEKLSHSCCFKGCT